MLCQDSPSRREFRCPRLQERGVIPVRPSSSCCGVPSRHPHPRHAKVTTCGVTCGCISGVSSSSSRFPTFHSVGLGSRRNSVVCPRLTLDGKLRPWTPVDKTDRTSTLGLPQLLDFETNLS